MKRTHPFIGITCLILLNSIVGCSVLESAINPATPTATSPPPSATATITPIPPTATATASASPTPVVTASESAELPEGTTPAAPSDSTVTLPVTFNIRLVAPPTSCGEGVSSEFTVTLSETAITMVQIEFQLTSTGPYNPATGAFTSLVSGLPGTETFTGVATFTPGAGGTVVSMNGEFTYTGDPEWTCTVPDVFSGQATITQ